MTDDQTYLAELERALKERGLDEARTAEVIGEMANHLAESGDRPLETFGQPAEFAASLLAADLTGQLPDADPDPRFEARTFRATAVDEMGILADLGADGWELTGVRDFGLHARRPLTTTSRSAWHYARRTAMRRRPVLAEMEADGWTPCGRWLTYHYFKRPIKMPA